MLTLILPLNLLHRFHLNLNREISKLNYRIHTNAIKDFATINQLLVLANMESYNAILNEQGKAQSDRLVALRGLAVKQLNTIESLNISTLPQSEKNND